jgi:5-methylcytosine-specific restriction endonuclease McrA
MKKENYYAAEYKHPNWQKKRLEILTRDNYTCKMCGDTETQLHVHHFTYEKGKKVWEYPDSNFVSLCNLCHSIEHSKPNWTELNKKIIQDITDVLKKNDFDDNAFIFHIMDLMENEKTKNILRLTWCAQDSDEILDKVYNILKKAD